MRDYTVLQVAPSGAEHALCLSDDAGEYHIARATAAVPRIGARLLGGAPSLGFGLLLEPPVEHVYRVIFEAVHCTEAEAHDSMSGSLTL